MEIITPVTYLDDEVDILSSMKSLSFIPSNKEKEVNPVLLSNIKPKKDKKKKKEKKKDKNKDFDFITGGDIGNVNEIRDDEDIESEIVDIDAILREIEESPSDMIIGEQKNSYKKRKNSENPYKKEFAEEMTLLYGLLDDVTKYGKDLEKQYKGLVGSKTRGASKYTNDLAASVLTSKTTQLSVIKEINSVKKTIADLKIKEDGRTAKASGGEGNGKSAEMVAASYFGNIMKYGRNNFIKALKDNEGSESMDDPLLTELQGSKDSGYNPYDNDVYQDMIDERLDAENNPFRSDCGSKYIEYENRGVKIYIKKCIDTGEWEFVALDRDNQQIYDYPIPDVKFIGKVKFSDDDEYATDSRGRSYKVITYFLPDEE